LEQEIEGVRACMYDVRIYACVCMYACACEGMYACAYICVCMLAI
jgi:hypothetical protein